MSDNRRYSGEYVKPVRDAAARDFLVTVGLPARYVIFLAVESSDGARVERIADRDLLKIGRGAEDNDFGNYYVDCATGAVVYVDISSRGVFHVSASPQLLADCLRAFDQVVYHTAGEDDPERIAELLAPAIEAADPTALGDDPVFWRSLFDDVAVGDYESD